MKHYLGTSQVLFKSVSVRSGCYFYRFQNIIDLAWNNSGASVYITTAMCELLECTLVYVAEYKGSRDPAKSCKTGWVF